MCWPNQTSEKMRGKVITCKLKQRMPLRWGRRHIEWPASVITEGDDQRDTLYCLRASVLTISDSSCHPAAADAQSIPCSLAPPPSCSRCSVAGSGEVVKGMQDALELSPCRPRRLCRVEWPRKSLIYMYQSSDVVAWKIRKSSNKCSINEIVVGVCYPEYCNYKDLRI
jgi:hypothetical protein